jgi:hypothetical protein
MSMSEPPIPLKTELYDLTEDWTKSAMGLLIAVGVALFVVGTIYLISPVDPADLPKLAAMVVPAL